MGRVSCRARGGGLGGDGGDGDGEDVDAGDVGDVGGDEDDGGANADTPSHVYGPDRTPLPLSCLQLSLLDSQPLSSAARYSTLRCERFLQRKNHALNDDDGDRDGRGGGVCESPSRD